MIYSNPLQSSQTVAADHPGTFETKNMDPKNKTLMFLFEESQFPTNLMMFYSLFLLSIFLGYLPRAS